MSESAGEAKEKAGFNPMSYLKAFNQWRRGNELKFYIGLWVLIAVVAWLIFKPAPEAVRVYMTTPGVTNLQLEKPRPDPLVLEFGDSVAKLNQIGKPASGVELSPTMQGQWKWDSDRKLVFIPEEEWKIAQAYSVKLDQDMFPSHILLDEYSLSFETAGFTASLENTEFYQDPENPKLKKLVSTVRFSHRLDQEDFKDRVKLIMKDADPRVKDKGKDYPYELSFNKVGNEAYIHSKPIDIPLKEQTLILTIDDGARSRDGGVKIDDELSTSVTVPGMYSYFRISNADVNLIRNEHNDPEQVLIVETTDGVEETILKKNIDILLLPKDRPATKGRKAVEDYAWYNVEEIGPEILKLAQPVAFKALPAEHKYAKVHSFRIDVPPQRSLYVRVKKGIESVGGYKLAKTFDTTSRVPEYPRELEIMGKGGVLSLSGDKQISVVSRGNRAVQFEVAKVLPGQVQHLISQTGGDFQDPYFVNYRFDEDNITERFTEVKRLRRVAPGKSQYTSFDLNSYLNRPGNRYRNGIFLVKIHGWDVANQRRTGVTDKRLILITDLGMLVKDNADKSRDLFVMSINRGGPVAQASVKVIGTNGLSVYNTHTDANGRAQIPELDGFERERTPTAFLVESGGDMAFLPFNRYDRKLDLSRFDIGGVRQHGESDALTAYLFSDRGIYRPGDTFNIGMIVKSSNWKRDLTGVPLQSVITDPRGLVIKDEKFGLSSSGFESLSYATRDSSPTGEYEVRLYLVKDEDERSLLGTTSIKLEEFLPDRMKITSVFSKERALGWVHPKELSARVNLKNLYGTPATERRITANMTLSPYHPVFQKYSAFRFYDPMKAEKGFSERLPEAQTDDNGEAEIALNLERFASASYNVSLSVNGYEAEGGRSVSTQRSILVSPRDFLVGYKADGKLDYVGKDSERKVRFIAIDPALELTAAQGLKIELIEQRYVSALVKQDNGTFKYQSVLKEKTLSEQKLAISAKGRDYPLPTATPGDYVLLVKDAKGTELNKVNFSVAGEANLARSLEKNAELQVKLNKRDYEPGEPIQVSIRAPYKGAGLITIERDKVYSYKWFRTNTTNTVQSITLPAGMEGNAYVNVSFVRALDSKEIFMSPLSYGIAPFTISRDARRNKVELDVPYLMRPGDRVKIGYKVQQPGKIVVFAVDEGILQVADYKTPRPLKHFFRKRALEVETSQILDLILPEYSVVREFSAAGGGMYEAESDNLNPFKRRTQKPVAYWSGILDVDGSGQLDYTVPDYFNGTLRFMAVAVSPGSLGATSRKALARGHFVLSPNVPTFAAPGDEFSISLNVANNVEGSGKGAKVKVALVTSEHLQVLEQEAQTLSIDEGREKSVRFKVKALDKLGSANFSFTAESGGKQATASVDLSVRPPLTRLVDVRGDSVQEDDVTLEMKRDMYSEFRERQVMMSPVPLGLANGMLRYLDEYPYFCTEQLVSKVFPIVALKDRTEFDYDDEKARKSIGLVVDILRSRQNGEGAFGFWAANSHVSPKQSIYALHFLREASASGYSIPEEMIERGFTYAREQAQKEINNLADARVRAYAIYQLTSAGEVTTRYLNDMREQMDKYYKGKWEQEISRAYMAAAYAMLHLDDEAEALIEDMELGAEIIIDYSTFYDSLSRDAQLLYILSRHFPEKVKGLEAKALDAIVRPVNNGYFNTISSSYSILALDAYAEVTGPAGEMNIKLVGEDAKGQKSDIAIPTTGLLPKIDIDAAINKLVLDASDESQPVFYQVNETGFDRKLPEKKLKGGLEVHREYRNLEGKEVDSVAMGEELEVHLQLRSLDGSRHYNVAVVDLLPGGFELVRDASRDSNSQWSPDYMDLREDRIVLYGTVGEDAEEFVYRIKATNQGAYVVPPPYAESMYNRKLRYRGLAARMTVK